MADVRERLARIETKLDLLVGLEPRVRKLERWKHFQAAVAAVFGSLAALFVRPHVGG